MDQAQIEALLSRLKVVLPNYAGDEINIEAILEFDPHDLQMQYAKDNMLYSYYSLLARHARYYKKMQGDKLSDLETDIKCRYKDTLELEGRKASPDDLKLRVHSDPQWRTMRDRLREIDYKVELLDGVVDSLNKKNLALTMVAAREKAELQSRIG